MKESAITPKVKELAKKIAEHWRMEIYKGDWILYKASEQYCLRLVDLNLLAQLNLHGYSDTDIIPIPSISDCLEKLRELGHVNLTIDTDEAESWVAIINPFHPKFEEARHDFVGKTLHQALLSALLEVLKNSDG